MTVDSPTGSTARSLGVSLFILGEAIGSALFFGPSLLLSPNKPTRFPRPDGPDELAKNGPGLTSCGAEYEVIRRFSLTSDGLDR